MVKSVIEGTIVLIILYLILANGKSFSSILQSGGSVYISSIKALQGR